MKVAPEPQSPQAMRSAAAREDIAEKTAFLSQVESFAHNTNDLGLICLVLTSISRVKLPANVSAAIQHSPQAQDIDNPLNADMQMGERACETLLTRAFTLANSLQDINRILACDYRFTPDQKIRGSLLYNIGHHLNQCLQTNEQIRTEIIAARTPDNPRSKTFLDFLAMMKAVEAYQSLAPILLELQVEATHRSVSQIADQYR